MFHRFSFFMLFFAIIIKLAAIHFTNFDLFGDEAQYLIWSEKLDFGYYSKHPLLAWLIKLYTLFFGDSFVAIKYFPLFFYFFTSYIVYLLSYELYHKKDLAIISALSFYLLPSVSISSFLLSTDVVLIFFCSLFLRVFALLDECDFKYEIGLFDFVAQGFVVSTECGEAECEPKHETSEKG